MQKTPVNRNKYFILIIPTVVTMMLIILNPLSPDCTYPGVAESHTDGSVDRHAELALWPLHV